MAKDDCFTPCESDLETATVKGTPTKEIIDVKGTMKTKVEIKHKLPVVV